MYYYKTKKEIIDALENYYSDYINKRIVKFTEDDLIIKRGWLYVNMANSKYYTDYGISIYKYPLNEYCECYSDVQNLNGKSFKDFVNEFQYENQLEVESE